MHQLQSSLKVLWVYVSNKTLINFIRKGSERFTEQRPENVEVVLLKQFITWKLILLILKKNTLKTT